MGVVLWNNYRSKDEFVLFSFRVEAEPKTFFIALGFMGIGIVFAYTPKKFRN